MQYKILESLGVEIENTDDAAFNSFLVSGESGIIAGVLNECRLIDLFGTVVIDTGELMIQGFRIKITEAYQYTPVGTAASRINYHIIGRLELHAGGEVSFNIITRTISELQQDDLHKLSSGIHEVELAKFTHYGDSISNLRPSIGFLTLAPILKPEFAQTEDDLKAHGDITKLYAVPDKDSGVPYIWAYMHTTETAGDYNNLYDKKTMATADYLNRRYSQSANSFTTASGYLSTPRIPYTISKGESVVVRTKGLPEQLTSYTNSRFWTFVNDTENKIGGTNTIFARLATVVDEGDGVYSYTLIPSTNQDTAYVMFNLYIKSGDITSADVEDAIITINQEIKEELISTYRWKNTGNAFVPADYEDRIIKAENDIKNIKEDITELQQAGGGSSDDIPDYVREEAERVAENVLTTPHDFSFALVSDLHSPTNDLGLKHGGQAMKIIAETAPLDAVVIVGDLIDNWTSRTIDQARTSISNCRRYFTNDRTPTFWVKGNHDCNGYPDNRLSNQEVYNRTAKQNRCGGITENENDPFGGYGYKDFDSAKVRLVFVNTSDNDAFPVSAPKQEGQVGQIINAHNISATQLQWIADYALDFSDKENTSDWTLVFASHVPIYSVYSEESPNIYNYGTYTDDNGVTYERNVVNLANMVKAYNDKTVFSVTLNGETASKDFSSLANTADVAGFFCGHLHALKMFEYNGFKFISVPPACNVDKVSADGNTYNKTAGTAKDTAFNVFVISKENRRIYAYCYGAGYDREVTY